MKHVYLVMCGEGNGRVLGVYANEMDATIQVKLNARTVHGINPLTDAVDFDGTLSRFGWADKIWWQKEVLY